MKLQVLEFSSAARVPGQRLEMPELPTLAGATYASSGLSAVLNPDTRFVTLSNRGNLPVATRLTTLAETASVLSDVVLNPGERFSFGIRNAVRGASSLRLSLVEVSS